MPNFTKCSEKENVRLTASDSLGLCRPTSKEVGVLKNSAECDFYDKFCDRQVNTML